MTIPPSLRALIEDPPADYSPVAMWWWSGDPLERARLQYQLRRFAEGGVYNLIVINLAPSGPTFGSDADEPAFFTDAWWELLDGVCGDAAELGVSLWFYDQLGFSGASIQARLVEERPEFAGQWLQPGGSVVTRGFDYLSVEAGAALIDRVHGEFERRLGHRLGNVIVGSFQDELPSVPTWSPRFAEQFARRRGYDVRPELALLWSDGERAAQVRHDFHLTRAELAEEAFFRPLAQWHDRYGLLHGCDQQDPARAGEPVAGVQLYADYARTHRWFGAPGSDHHGDARIHSSLAHLYGRTRTWVEAFHSSGWGGTLEETYDWLLPWLRAGATLYNPHAVYYSTRAGWWEWAPPGTDWRQPYWRHYRVFAEAVTRLCAVLAQGRHLCDVAVLLPTATAQAGTRLDGVDDAAVHADRCYRELIGDMAWFNAVPGLLDRLGVDADVIDDDSVQRAAVQSGRLAVADEAYSVVLLPACTVLEEGTAVRLAEFAVNGGTVVAVGTRPERGVGGPGADDAVARLRPLLVDADGDELAARLAAARPVESPAPTLARVVDDTTVVLVTAADGTASRIAVAHPQERGIELGWLDVTYDFDPARYRNEATLRVRGEHAAAVLVSPFGGSPRPLPVRHVGDRTEVTVPFDDGPAALVLFPPSAASVVAAPAPPTVVAELPLAGEWEVELVPTLDNAWGDFALPPAAPAGLEQWELERADGGAWVPAYATFGPHATWEGPDGERSPAVYSDSRGIRKDPVHRETLGPKGHVPEEFLQYGSVAAGQRVSLHSVLTVPEPGGYLAVGAPAAKQALLDGVELPMDDRGHLALAQGPTAPGRYELELRLTAEEDLELRAHVAVVTDPDRYRRPEWLVASEAVEPGDEVRFSTTLGEGTTLQVVSAHACRVLVDGVEVGRQGGFDPYVEHEHPRAGRYDVSGCPTGAELTVVVTTAASPPRLLVDGRAVSGPGWSGRVRPARRQYGDPAAVHLARRPHPLPASDWLEPAPADGTVRPAVLDPVGATDRETLRFVVPPGALAIDVDVHGEATLTVDGRVVAAGAGEPVHLAAELPDGHLSGPREGRLEMRTVAGHRGGAALAGPIRFATGVGRAPAGDWEAVGFPGWSGGVRYRRELTVDPRPGARAVLDLGRVRGTAEVTVNGRPAGVRIGTPFAFDVTDYLEPGRNEVSVLVLGTLAPYFDMVSPSHFVFPGQRTSGLLGPVELRWTAPGSAASGE